MSAIKSSKGLHRPGFHLQYLLSRRMNIHFDVVTVDIMPFLSAIKATNVVFALGTGSSEFHFNFHNQIAM